MEHKEWYTATLMPSYFRRERKKRERSVVIHAAFAGICGISAVVLILRGDTLAVFAAAAITVNAADVRGELREIRELKAAEAQAREIQLAAIFEAHKRFEEREVGEGENENV